MEEENPKKVDIFGLWHLAGDDGHNRPGAPRLSELEMSMMSDCKFAQAPSQSVSPDGSGPNGHRRSHMLCSISTLALGAMLALGLPGTARAQSVPTGGTVVAGTASIGSGGAGALRIEQSSAKAIINWSDFSIGAGGAVRFNNGDGATLNRVTGGNISSIEGSLTATGSVYLLNPNGIIVGKSGVVNVGGNFVASTGDVSNAEFLQGGPLNFRGAGNAVVVNLGHIGALGGDVALIGGVVDNKGGIVAPKGEVGLIAGHDVVMQDSSLDQGRFLVAVGGSDTSASNSGRIDAAMVELRAQGGNVYALAGNTEGVIRATGVATRGGKIFLTAGDQGSVTIAGSSLQAADGAGNGGAITATAGKVSLAADAKLDVSATSLTGSGGTVLTMADMVAGHLDAQGQIAARGGAQGGNGGKVETSGASVNFTGVRVDTSAPAGQTGEWLIDPYDLTVDAAAATTINTNLASTSVTLQTTAGGSTGPGTVNASGSGDITVNSAITWATGNTLTLDAYRNVNINAAVTASGGGKVVLVTGDTAGNGTSGSATGDYSFGLGAGGFAGSLNFTGGSASGSTLSIGTRGLGAAAAYTLIYDLGATATGLGSLNAKTSGNYALATSQDAATLNSGNPLTTSVVGTFGAYGGANIVGNFTGLGHTVSNLKISSSAINVGLFGQTQSVIFRDIGVPSGTVTGTNASGNVGAVIGNAAYSKVSNIYAAIPVSGGNTGNNAGTGGLIGYLQGNGAQSIGLTNAWSTGAVTGKDNTGGAIGYLGGIGSSSSFISPISNVYTTGTVTSSTGYIGGLIGLVSGSNLQFSNVHATGNITQTGAGSNVGGLIGMIGGSSSTSPTTITSAYATGTISALGNNVGGLIGWVNATTNISNAYATGSVTTSGTTGYVGGLIGQAYLLTLGYSYATGNVSAIGTGAQFIGGLVGYTNTGNINVSFATGDVIGYGYVGGLVGQAISATNYVDVYAQGDVRATSTAVNSSTAGGLIGYFQPNTFTSYVTNAYASGAVSAAGAPGTASTGGLFGAWGGSNGGPGIVTNGYWDSTTTGQSAAAPAAGRGGTLRYATGTAIPTTTNNTVSTRTAGALTTAQLTDGSLPTNFNTAVTTDGTPWHTGNGMYPYFQLPGYVPDGAQTISGYAYGTNGVTPSGSANINLYFSGGILAGNITADATTGFYTTFVGANTITAASKLGGTMALSGSPSAVVGATYTDTPTLTLGNVTDFNITQNLFQISTTDANQTTLNASLNSTFGASNYTALASTLNGANWLVKASNPFTIDTGFSRGGSITVQSGGALTIGASGSIASTAGGVTLAANGAFTNNGGASAITANTRWLVYSQATNNPTGTPTFASAGGLVGKNYYGDAYNFTTSSLASTPTSGNRFVYGYQPTLTATPDTKSLVFNGATQSDSYALSGYLSGDAANDSVTGSVTGLTTSSKNAGAYVLNANGTLASDLNYAIAYGSGTLTITPAALTVGTSNVTKTFDGGTSAAGSASLVSGTLYGSDSLSGGSFAFTNKNAGIGNKTVTVSGVTVSDGNSGGNYTLSYQDNTTSTINRMALTVSTSDVVKTYDGTTGATGSAVVTGGTLYGTDSLSGGSFAFADKNAGIGNKTVTVAGVSVSDGNSGGNYTVSFANNTTSTINPFALTVTAPQVTKTYDGTTSATGSATVGSLVSGDVVSGAAVLAYADPNAGINKTVTASGLVIRDGSNADMTGNYAITYVDDLTSVINAATLTVTANNDAKIVTTSDVGGYMGASYSGFVGGEGVGDLGGALSITRAVWASMKPRAPIPERSRRPASPRAIIRSAMSMATIRSSRPITCWCAARTAALPMASRPASGPGISRSSI
jgi:filamentous hemagglutinin family protein